MPGGRFKQSALKPFQLHADIAETCTGHSRLQGDVSCHTLASAFIDQVPIRRCLRYVSRFASSGSDGSYVHPNGKHVVWVGKSLDSERELDFRVPRFVNTRGLNHLHDAVHIHETGMKRETWGTRTQRGCCIGQP